MKKLYYSFSIILCTIFLACSSKSNKSAKIESGIVISMNLDNEKPLIASTLFDTIMYVPLETSDSFLFSRISHLKVSDNNAYFISDKSFFLFDTETGEGKTKISKLGAGPEGYVSVFDSNIDISSNEIELLDNNAKKIVVYDMNGNFKRSIPLPFTSFTFTKTDKNTYWLYNNNLLSDASNSKVVHFNSDKNNVVEEYDKIDKHLAEYFFVEDETNLIRHGNCLLYHSSPSDKIYQITPGVGIKTSYVLDLGKYKAPENFYSAKYQDIMEFVEAANKNNYVFEIPTFSVNDKMLAIACMKEGKLYTTFHMRESGNNITYSSFYDNFNFSKPLPLEAKNISFCLDNKYFYFIIMPEQLINLQQNSSNRSKIDKWMNDKKITEFSNPILVKCRLKTN